MNALRTVSAPLRILPRQLQWKWAALVPLIAITTAVELAAAASIYLLVARASAGTLTTRFISLAASLFIGRTLLQWLTTVVQHEATSDSIAASFVALFAGTLSAPYEFHRQHRAAEQTHRLTVAIDTTYRLVMSSAAGLVSEAFVFLALTALLIIKAPLEATITIAILAIVVLTRRSVAKWGSDVYARSEKTLHEVQEILAGVKEIKTAQREAAFLHRAAATQKEYAEALRRHLFAVTKPRLLIETAFVVVAFGIFFLLPHNGDLLPLLALFAYAGFRLIPSVSRIVYHLDHIRHGERAVIELEAALREVGQFAIVQRPERGFDFEHAIEIDGITFAYGDRILLSGVSLNIAKGEWIGLTGENGAGKSTLLEIVAGLLRPAAGSVRIDGVPLDAWLATSPPLIGYVPQRPHMFDDTIASNVSLGSGEAAAVGLDPNANATLLSGGERQRVAIARALHTLPPILLFDEPTTALDPVTETYYATVLGQLKGKTTAILVSHRAETLAWCDRIVTLRDGTLAPAPPPRSSASGPGSDPAQMPGLASEEAAAAPAASTPTQARR